MSTIIVSAILITITIAVPLVFISISKRNIKKRNEKHLKLFSLAGLNHDLSFSKYEILKTKIIGLDNLHQSLLIYEIKDANVIRINMKEVNSCLVNKEYDNIDMGTDKKAKVERHLRCIDLKFGFQGGTSPISISFYNSSVNSIYRCVR